MLLIIRKKNNHQVVFTQAFPEKETGINPATIYADFDPDHMEVAWHTDEFPPAYFEVDEEGMAKHLSTPPTIEINGRFHSLGYKTHKGKAVQRTLAELVKSGDIELNVPFEQVNGEQIDLLSAEEVLEKEAIHSLVGAENFLQYVRRESLAAISAAFPTSDELKRTKGFLDWLNEGKPKNDPRKAAYDEMQDKIKEIKARYADMKAYAKAKIAEFGNNAVPTASHTKAEIMAWLDEQGIEYKQSETKKELLTKVEKG